MSKLDEMALEAAVDALKAQLSYGELMTSEERQEHARISITAYLSYSPAAEPVVRCLVTGNPVGTDTLQRGHSCPCAVCQSYTAAPVELDALRRERDEAVRLLERAKDGVDTLLMLDILACLSRLSRKDTDNG